MAIGGGSGGSGVAQPALMRTRASSPITRLTPNRLDSMTPSREESSSGLGVRLGVRVYHLRRRVSGVADGARWSHVTLDAEAAPLSRRRPQRKRGHRA